MLSQADPRALYYANQFVFKSTDGGAVVDAHQRRPDPARSRASRRTSTRRRRPDDRNGKRGVVYTIAPSPLLVPMVWIGTDDGLIKVTIERRQGVDGRDAAGDDVVEPRHHHRGVALRLQHARTPAWTATSSGLRALHLPHPGHGEDVAGASPTGLPADGYVHVVREDPERQGLLFAGTERGAFVSFDDGDHWQPLQLNLPVTSVRDFQVYDGDLIVATHGRGFWVIDDIGALRQADATCAQADAYLFKPRDTVARTTRAATTARPSRRTSPRRRTRPRARTSTTGLEADASGPVTLEILDADGRGLHTFSSEYTPRTGRRVRVAGGGIPNTSALWRQPPEPFSNAPGCTAPCGTPRRAEGGSAVVRRAGGATPAGDVPGEFTARLTVNGETYKQTFSVRPDPRGVQEWRESS